MKYKVEGICHVEASWFDMPVIQVLEVEHEELELRDEMEIDALESGTETVSVEFELVIEANSEEEAKKKVLEMLGDPDSWDATTLIGSEEIPTKVGEEVEVEILKVEKVE